MEQAKSKKLIRSLSSIFALAMFFFFAGCAQKLPKPSENVKAVLVIPAEMVNKTQIERKYDYVFNFQSKHST